MLEERIREICLELGYDPTEFLMNSQGTSVASVQARSSDGGMAVLRFIASTGGNGAAGNYFDTQRWNTGNYSTGYVNGAQSVGTGRDQGKDEQVLQEIALRWSIGVMGGGRYVNPVSEFGYMGKYIYQVRPCYPITLHHLIERQVSPGNAVLFRVVDQLWASLAFLHQSTVNQPHGALNTHNVGFSSNKIIEAEASLLDLKETAETRRAELKRQDFQNLGMLIYQFVGSLEKPVDAVDAIMRCPNASWTQLGSQEKEWKALIVRLLDVESFPFGYDLAGAREQLLAPLQPSKTPFAAVFSPRPVNEEPPYRMGVQQLSETKAVMDYRGEIERLLAAGEHLNALRVLLMVPEDFKPREQVLTWGDTIADVSEDVLATNTEFLGGLEILANSGAPRAGLRLGRILSKSQPFEALTWLDSAMKTGLTESYGLIAAIYEHGGEGVVADPSKALEFYQASLDHYDASDWEVAYQMAALILREKPLQERLPQAIQLLELCNANGHYRSTDLLAQCYAQGLGLLADEKKAFQLFVDSWNRSKKRNEAYYTASNNLGVCFAIGFGTRKDPAMARHYFKQGEIVGHEASKKNLHALAQSS